MIDQHIDFVKEQIDFHKGRIELLPEKDKRKFKHLETAKKFEALLLDLERIAEETERKGELRGTGQPKLSLTPSDIEDLPEELLNELSFSDSDMAEFAILGMMEENDGVMSLDQIIVGLYKETEQIHRRQTVTSRLYRMASKGLVYNVPGKKGVYSLRPMSEEEVSSLFG